VLRNAKRFIYVTVRQHYDMKILQYFLILILSTSCSKEYVRKTDLEVMNLNGKVKSIMISQYKASSIGGVIKKEKVDNSGNSVSIDNQFFFNKKGMKTEQREYLSDKINHRYLFQYDKNLNLIKKEYYNSKGELINESNFKNIHNSNGELIEESEFMTDKQFKENWSQIIFKNKNKIKKNEYLGTEIYNSYEYQYDENGNNIQQIIYDTYGTIIIKIKNTFDDENNVIKETVFDKNNEVISQEKFEYTEFDSHKNRKRVLIYKNDRITNLTDYEIEYY